MTHHKLHSLIDRVFKDKRNKWAIIQLPNVPISIWIILTVISLFVQGSFLAHLNLLRNSLLFVWAYLEISKGDSLFRRALGAIVLVMITAGYFHS